MKIRFLLQPTSRITLEQETSLLDVFTSTAVILVLGLKKGRETQKGVCFLGVSPQNCFPDSEKMIMGLTEPEDMSCFPLEAAKRGHSLLLHSKGDFV